MTQEKTRFIQAILSCKHTYYRNQTKELQSKTTQNFWQGRSCIWLSPFQCCVCQLQISTHLKDVSKWTSCRWPAGTLLALQWVRERKTRFKEKIHLNNHQLMSLVILCVEVFNQANYQTICTIITLLLAAFLLDFARKFVSNVTSFSDVFVGAKCYCIFG